MISNKILLNVVTRRVVGCGVGRQLGAALSLGREASSFKKSALITSFLLGWSHYNSTSATFALLARRRKRGGRDNVIMGPPPKKSENEDDEPTSSRSMDKVVKDPEKFQTAAIALLEKLHKSLKPLERINDNMFVTRGDAGDREDLDHDEEEASDMFVRGEYLRVDLGAVDGEYTIHVDKSLHNVVLSSPISGIYFYHLTYAGEFLCLQDGHNLEGIFVRDLIRQIKGVPKL